MQSPPKQDEKHAVTLMVRQTCGSCERVHDQILPIVQRYGATLEVVDVDAGDGDFAVEFGDRVPVVLVDDEEIACWEIDDEELIEAITS